jgi:hypothetical protein
MRVGKNDPQQRNGKEIYIVSKCMLDVLDVEGWMLLL